MISKKFFIIYIYAWGVYRWIINYGLRKNSGSHEEGACQESKSNIIGLSFSLNYSFFILILYTNGLKNAEWSTGTFTDVML